MVKHTVSTLGTCSHVWPHLLKMCVCEPICTRYCKKMQTCYFGNFGHAWPCTPKMIVSTWRKLWCLDAGKKSTSSLTYISWYIAQDIIAKLLFGYLGTLGMPWQVHSKCRYKHIENYNVYLHGKNQLHHSFHSENTLKIIPTFYSCVWN